MNALGLTTLLAALVSMHALPAANTTRPGHTYVFGQLRRAGDAASFTRDPRWRPLGNGSEVTLVVVPHETAPGSLHSPVELRTAQDRGQLFMLQ